MFMTGKGSKVMGSLLDFTQGRGKKEPREKAWVSIGGWGWGAIGVENVFPYIFLNLACSVSQCLAGLFKRTVDKISFRSIVGDLDCLQRESSRHAGKSEEFLRTEVPSINLVLIVLILHHSLIL